ncbi:Smr/MutS family protein [Maritimibacter sp. UBA3975]|uniref:Smr/MutS family protein n=1 Tax=Maritimibacter sp. UBA3975 TaxID=1946833 RepID=UPI0025B7BF6F|nr:Smr/MutS family protein [Maritimibacter sp. UBA3975]
MARRPRHLSAEERALWDEVARRTQPMRRDKPAQGAKDALVPEPKPAPKPLKFDEFRVGDKAKTSLPPHDVAAPIRDSVSGRPVEMDRKRFQQLKRGKMKPEARIDLHGMTMAQAHPALLRFILESASQGRRLVLVITGKGKVRDHPGPIPERHGVLRHQVPHWLQSPPLRTHVLQLTEAHHKHGGLGAYYVYLRRGR